MNKSQLPGNLSRQRLSDKISKERPAITELILLSTDYTTPVGCYDFNFRHKVVRLIPRIFAAFVFE